MTDVYLALYKGNRKGNSLSSIKAKIGDWLIRKFTRGIYSHCELAVKKETNFTDRYDCDTYYECYSSSVRDGGVRCKIIDVTDGKWDLIKLNNVTEAQIEYYCRITKGKKYDWFGAVGIILGIKERRDKFFCSEWCFNVITLSTDGWRFSPNDLAVIARRF